MKLQKPYKRIIRPLGSQNSYTVGYRPNENYIADPRYADDRFELVRAYHILESDLVRLFEYVEPADANLSTYSYRIYELFLRASTEFESNAKKILLANGYRNRGRLNIEDYYKINAASKLNEYTLKLNIWASGSKEIQPYQEWSSVHSLSWYQAYNSVKHNRYDEFHQASLENLINAVGATFCILFSQFHNFAFTPHQTNMMWNHDDTNYLSDSNSIFSIKLPRSWQESEMYGFDWSNLHRETDPFDNFSF